MLRRRRPSETWNHPRWIYHRRALTHYGQAAAIGAPVVVGVLTLSVIAAGVLFAASEILLLVLLPSLAPFRRSVDQSLHRAACLRAATARAVWLTRMGEEHRIELHYLEELARRIERPAAATETDWLGLDDLLALYVELAIRLRESSITFAPVEDARLAAAITELETRAALEGEAGEAWAARRLAILKHRRETRRRAREERELLVEQLATIAATVQWMYEEAEIARGTERASTEQAVTVALKNGAFLRELSAMRTDGAVAAETLRLGRCTPAVLATTD